MPPKVINIYLSLIAAAFCVPALQASAGTYNAVVDIGDPMPIFENLPSISGEMVSSSDFETADILILVSMANHCPWSNGADADTSALADEYRDRNVALLAFSVSHREQDNLLAMTKHAEENNYSFDYIYDESQELGYALGASATPEYYVYDQRRRLVYTGLLHNPPGIRRAGTSRYTEGAPVEFYVKDAINAVLAGEEVAVTETQSFGCLVEYEP